MLFKDIIGQQQVIQKLRGMVTSERVPHALMLLGPQGNGGLALALALAQYAHCENRGEDSCGVCSSCIKHQKYVHPDVHFTFPVITKKPGEKPISADYLKEWRLALSENVYMNANDWLQSIGAENQQGNITVRECHEIIRSMSLKTYEAQYKIQIIWMAEYLKETGNTLLKVIEEPPDDTIFILIVENIEMMLTTIISRTQLVKVNAIESDDMKQALLQRFEMDDASARRIVRIADGNFNAALTIAGGEDSDNDKLLHQWLLACFNLKQKSSLENTQNLFEWIDDISKIGRENQKIFLKYSLFFLRECALVRLTQKSEKLEGSELQFAQRLSARLEPDQFEILAKIINRLSYHIERNANPKIQFLSNSFRIASVFKQEEVTV
jgi:DNA polymerase-3 subunit delta'